MSNRSNAKHEVAADSALVMNSCCSAVSSVLLYEPSRVRRVGETGWIHWRNSFIDQKSDY